MYLRRLSQTRLALGCDTMLAIVSDMTADEADRLFKKLWKQVYVFERRFSRFLPMSELSTFNRTTGLKTPITPEFKDLLTSAKQLGVKTNGLYNPFITPALQRAGYMKSAVPGYEHDSTADYTIRRVVGVERLNIGDDWAQIPYGTALDMGGCGKGYLADQLGKILKNYKVQGYWLSLGGDILTMGRDENGNNITLDIQNANQPSHTTDWIIECPTNSFAVATSGTFRRIGQDVKNNWHHIIDPTTLEPAKTDIRLATVCAETAAWADVLASCAVIVGSYKAPAFLKKHGVKSALLQGIDSDGVVFEKVIGAHIHKTNLDRSMAVVNHA